jgi:putative heme-binding domain-containing protein
MRCRKAAEHCRTPGRWRVFASAWRRRKVLECGCPLLPSSAQVRLAALLGGFFLAWSCPALAKDAGSQSNSNRTAIALEALERLKGIDLEANPGVKAAVLKVLEQTRGTPQFVGLVRDFKIKGQETALLELAGKNPTNSYGVEATRLVLNSGNKNLLQKSLSESNAVSIAEALGNTGEKEIVPLLEPIVTDGTRDVALRRHAVRALAQVQEGASALLQLVQEDKLPADLKFTASAALNNVRWENLKAEAARLLPLPQGQDAQPLPPISELMRLKGDPVKGAAVFRRDTTTSCIKCHQVNGEGIDFGPNLSEIGAKLGKDALYEAILDPSAGISFGFEAWQLALKDGNEAYGMIVSETAEELAFKTAGGIVTRYPKTEIKSRVQQKLSIMPAGLQQTISRQDLIDLVEYLSSLKKAVR